MNDATDAHRDRQRRDRQRSADRRRALSTTGSSAPEAAAHAPWPAAARPRRCPCPGSRGRRAARAGSCGPGSHTEAAQHFLSRRPHTEGVSVVCSRRKGKHCYISLCCGCAGAPEQRRHSHHCVAPVHHADTVRHLSVECRQRRAQRNSDRRTQGTDAAAQQKRNADSEMHRLCSWVAESACGEPPRARRL